MSRAYRGRELVLGIQGLALLRHAIDGDEKFLRDRLDDIRRFAAAEERPSDNGPVARELDAAKGYAAWSAIYDSLPNSFIEVEELVVHALLDPLPPGTALDAACGTGRQTRALTSRGHRTIGVDQSPQMLDKARSNAPSADYRVGRLESLPLEDDSVDLAVCSLALTHLSDPCTGIAELARVVRPGGRIILSDLHPFVVSLQGQCLFAEGPGRLAFVRNHVHLPGRYLAAFRQAGLTVNDCHEPLFNGRLAPGGYEESVADAARAAWDGLPLVIVWDLTLPA
ncbi:class I SAM-dependent methyltransferase [Streptomyces sp. NPDC050355]|uniref:class I SAM-dependent methyltransferase n=1 Tax=Streptomyces sp. NPDC050355 TaxID=3365609 RepID=UPI0037A62B42